MNEPKGEAFMPRRSRLNRLPTFMRRGALALLTLLFSVHALADAPVFTGDVIVASGSSTIVNLRAQGAITGTAPMNVQVTGVRVGGVLSWL